MLKVEINDIDKYAVNINLTKKLLNKAFENILEKIDMNLETFTNKFPSWSSENNIYHAIDNEGWTTGFWTGMLWLAYEMTSIPKYRHAAEIQVHSFRKRLDEKYGLNHHDLGFLYSPSCVAAYKLTGNEEAKETAIKAADFLMSRFQKKGGFIQAWGELDDQNEYRLIIDCLLNLPLLYWAKEVTGDENYASIADEHFRATVNNIFRENASTYHTFFFDIKTGNPLKGVTAQGYQNNSCWARGQAWGIYGLPLNYKYTKNKLIFELYENCTNYFLNRLPEDYVCYWDMFFTDGDEPRDSSAAAIAVCGMLEMNKWIDSKNPIKKIYNNASKLILNSLINNYTTGNLPKSNGLLLHGVYAKPQNIGVDECTIWGDYYYMEALVRLLKDWELYW